MVEKDKEGLGQDVGVPIRHDSKSAVLTKDIHEIAMFFGRFILIVAGIVVTGFILKYIWAGLLPVILALLVATVMVPVAHFLRNKLRFPSALATLTTMVGFFAIIGGVIAAMVAVVSAQGEELVNQARQGFYELSKLTQNLPVEIPVERLDEAVTEITGMVKNQASNIAGGVMSGFSTVSSIVIGLIIMLFLSFYITKDGEKFLPWLRKYTGSPLGWHLTELGSRIWKTLSGFIQTQALVALVDAIFIGLGLWALQVPLALVIAVVTFFAGFIPLIGAIVAGLLAVSIALVSNGLTNALLALLLVILVQQFEGNVLQPLLQSKAMGLHAAIVLLSVTVGGGLAGIVGAFLAVPVAATIAVVLRYHGVTAALRAGEVDPEEVDIVTPGDQNEHGSVANKIRELYRELAKESYDPAHEVVATGNHAK
ncbi:membrane protein [Corynebacterium phocae]|uniref:Membrane protein n=2 Tax=Corynebacterium phocae TaxID=161895 RepID=A0A1L7D6Q2_9CORY|nr:AI-2E family transporter [Corynebacterium phocae]APT93800.1 membrane protein [Corynebacterium phocae]KAA8721751.1 AI-2E family transporter [Corynebacterium phocae]